MAALRKQQHEQFAVLVATEVIPSEAYVQVYGETTGASASACRLLKRADISARVQELKAIQDRAVANLIPKLVERNIVDRAVRVKLLSDYLMKLEAVAEARRMDSEHATVPGYATGIVAVTWKQLGKDGPIVKEAQVDVGMLRELRAHGEQIAKELGQWIDRQELSKPVEEYTMEELERLVAEDKAKSLERANRVQ